MTDTTKYKTTQRAQLRRQRYAERTLVNGRWFHPRVTHGQPGSYQNWGCRCEECTTASVQSRRRWRKDDPAWTQNQRDRAANNRKQR